MGPEERRLAGRGYHLDESDPDVAVLRRADGSFVAAFSAMGATEEEIRRAVEEDRRAAPGGDPGRSSRLA